MTWVISLLLLSIYTYVCVRSVRKGLLVFAASLPLYLIRLEIGPLPTTLLELMFWVLAIVWALGFVEKGRRLSIKELALQYKWLTLGIWLVIAGAFLGLTQSQDILGSLNVIKSYIVEPVLLGFIVWNISQSSKNFRIRQFLTALAVPVIAVSAVAIFQKFTGLTIPLAWAAEGRVTSIFPYPNALGHFVAPIVTVLAIFVTDDKVRVTPQQRHTLNAALLLGSIAVILAQTEAAIIAIFDSFVFVSFFYREGKRYTLPVLAVIIALTLAVPQLRTLAVQKVGLQDWSGQVRIAQWKETTNFLTDKPQHFLLGAGPDNYPAAIAPYHTHEHLEIFQYPHNLILNTWVEFGLLGVAGTVIIIGSVWIVAIRKWNRYYVVPLIGGLTEMGIHGLVDVSFLKNDLAMLTSFFVILLLIAAEREKAFETKTLFER